MPDGHYVGSFAVEDGAGRSEPLRAGDYLLAVDGEGICPQRLPCRVEDGVETRLDVVVQTGTPVQLRFVPPAGAAAPRAVDVAILEAGGGAVVAQRSVWGAQAFTLSTMLRPGRYRVEAASDEVVGPKLRCAAEFVVGAAAVARSFALARHD